MAKIKDTDYLHLSTRIRAMENALLERERMDRMLEAGTVEEAAKVLTECGYPELQAVNVDTVDAMLAQAREELFGTLNDLAPDGEILDVFKVKYDYHNAKAMLKCEALGLDPERLLVDTGRVAPETLAEAVKRSEFTDLPKVMADAIVEARAVLGKTRDPQRSDMILDQAYFQEMEQLAKVLADANDKYLRLAAEYDNYRKRTAKEKESIYGDAKADTIKPLLAVYDNLERGIAQYDEADAHRQGLELILRQFTETLTKLGVTEIEAKGQPFDPGLHNAVMHVEDETAGENTVVEVFQKGFMLGDKVLRFAMVKVAN